MATEFEVIIQTKAPLRGAIEYYLHPENIAKVHQEFVKDIKIVGREKDSVTFEQHGVRMGRKRKMDNNLWLDRANNTFTLETLDGDGKGSTITMAIREIQAGTEIRYSAAMDFGTLGFFSKGSAKSTLEKVAQEDKRQLDMLAKV